MVVTIDPARRLATALGMTGLADTPQRVPAGQVLGPDAGELWALQLDARATFDRLVGRYAPDEEARERILENRIYRHLSGTVAGAQEYMAVERLHELIDEGRFERIVLDTPPAANALDFLDAPARITRFIEGRALRLLLRPANAAGGLRLEDPARRQQHRHLAAGAAHRRPAPARRGRLPRRLRRACTRASPTGPRRCAALLMSDDSAFVVVAAPEADPLAPGAGAGRPAARRRLPVPGGGAEPRPPPAARRPAAPRSDARRPGRGGRRRPDGLAARAIATLAEDQVLGLRDLDAREFLRTALHGGQVVEVPAFTHEPVELAGIAEVAAALGA